MSEDLHAAIPQKCVIVCAILSTGMCLIVFLLEFLDSSKYNLAKKNIKIMYDYSTGHTTMPK